MKKATLKDIAEQAGVSVATVSYVLSNKATSKISEETKLKIYQVASSLNYKRDFVSSLLNGKTNQIGIYVGSYDFPITKSEIFKFIDKLAIHLRLNGYSLIIIPSGTKDFFDNLDAVLCVGVTDEEFITLSKNNIIPILAIDSMKHIQWTFQFRHTFKDIGTKFAIDDYTLVLPKPNSKTLRKVIEDNNQNVLFIDNYQQLNNLLSTFNDKNIVVAGNDLFEFLQTKSLKLYKYNLYPDSMINQTIEALNLAINHTDTNAHDYEY